MKKLFLLFSIIMLIPALSLAQYSESVENFDVKLDSAYFDTETSDNANPDTGYINWSYETNNTAAGAGALGMDYSAHNTEGWGGYSKIEHILPDSQVYNWAGWDSISFWYYNETPASASGRVHLRFELYEVSDVPDTTSSASAMEFYYSFEYVLDDAPGWNEWKLVLKDGRGDGTLDEWNGEAFNRTGWAGVTGNDQLDLDKIKGWAFEVSINGSGNHDFVNGNVIIDEITLKGYAGKSLVIFDGRNVPPAIEAGIFTWGQSTLDVVDSAGIEGAKSNALRWTQGDGWTGAGYNLPVTDLSREWNRDSIKFAMKAPVGQGDLRLQFEDGSAKVKTTFSPSVDDGGWHYYAFALKDFVYEEGSNFDSSAITTFQFVSEGNGVAGREILFDFLWTGNPDIDVTPPDPPANVHAIPNPTGYYNIVVWEEPLEDGEVYDVYASEAPITDINAPGVEIIASRVEEGVKEAKHELVYPVKDKDVTYYYAVTCTDAAGNVSEPGVSANGSTNTAQGIATISLNPPVDFAADGDVTEWINAGIEPIMLRPSVNKIAAGSFTDDDDFSADVYIAVDDDYLYFAFDMVDDSYNPSINGDWWANDAPEIFMGLYNQTKVHTAYQKGSEPDMQMEVHYDKLHEARIANSDLLTIDDADFEFINYAAAYWAVEFKVSLDSLCAASDVDRFHPMNGMRIPLDLNLHDNDGASGTHDGALAYSNNNNDNSWQSPQNWFYTWIGDTNKVTAIEKEESAKIVRNYALEQNYPNPFNPSTTIEYYLPKSSLVNLSVYNILGQKVLTLVDGKQTSGLQKVTFNGSNLSTGVYFYKIQAGEFVQVKKMLLVK